MNNLRLRSPGPAQRAAGEIKNTINGVANGVRELTDTLDEIRAQANTAAEPAHAVDKQATEEPTRTETVSPPANGSGVTEIQEVARRPDVAPVAPDVRVTPAAFVQPAVPDIRPQLEAVRDALVRNQQLTLSTLQEMRLLLDAQSRQLGELREQIKGQQNVMGNMRRF